MLILLGAMKGNVGETGYWKAADVEGVNPTCVDSTLSF